jgi:hypothetical protein
MMNARTRIILKGWLCLALLGILVSEAAAFVVTLAFPPPWDAAFSILILAVQTFTVILGIWWAVQDARRSYDRAVKTGYVTFTPDGRFVTSIKRDCPMRWFVTLHITLHPELIDV